MDNICDRVFALRSFDFPGNIREIEKEGVYVRLSGDSATVGFQTNVQKARAYFLLMTKYLAGERDFELFQTAHFQTAGPMLDVSFGRVLRVETVKDLIVRFAALGFNMMMLYTEDTYTLEGYPFFGYMRGRYSMAELREIDDFAFEMGIEIIPCIQTFGHLSSYLRWKEAAEFRDTSSVLLADEEKTYVFIEQEIRTMRAAFRSDRIHLGMDETKDLGLGTYLEKHGYQDKMTIYRKHMARVLKIAEKYYQSTMIWSDMLFSAPGYGDYDLDFDLPQSRIDETPTKPMLVFWDYYHKNYEFYDRNLTRHERFKNPTAFAGAVWTWDGLAPNLDYTLATTKPALLAALDHNVDTVIATTWISSQCGCDFHHALGGFCVFSEYLWRGKDCTDADIYEASASISGTDEELFHAVSEYSLGFNGAVSMSKAFFYGDPLIDLIRYDIDPADAAKRLKKAKRIIDKRADYPYRSYFSELFACNAGKATLLSDLRAAYAARDMIRLEKIAKRDIPRLKKHYAAFHALFVENWKKTAKPFGMEAYSADMGGIIQRLQDAAEIILDFVNGNIDRIEEMEEKTLPGINKTWQVPHSYMSISW